MADAYGDGKVEVCADRILATDRLGVAVAWPRPDARFVEVDMQHKVVVPPRVLVAVARVDVDVEHRNLHPILGVPCVGFAELHHRGNGG